MIENVPSQNALKGGALPLCDNIYAQNHGVIQLGTGPRLAKGRIHEALGDSADSFALCVSAATHGPIVWIGLGRDLRSLCPAGIEPFIDPARLLITEGVTRTDVLFAGEQALRCAGVSTVIVHVDRGPNLTESRRLQLAAEEGGAIGLILISGRAQTSAAETRWQCDGVYEPQATWRWGCVKNRKGETGMWCVTWAGTIGSGGEYGPDLIYMVPATAA